MHIYLSCEVAMRLDPKRCSAGGLLRRQDPVRAGAAGIWPELHHHRYPGGPGAGGFRVQGELQPHCALVHGLYDTE